MDEEGKRSSKRVRLTTVELDIDSDSDARLCVPKDPSITGLQTLSRSVSPPTRSRPSNAASKKTDVTVATNIASRTVPSPIQLTHIRDLPAACNVDTVKLTDILGDPLIKECWQFNFLFDLDFLMSQFDEDVRTLVDVKIVHGSWKAEAPNKIRIDEACKRHRNVQAITAYMPEPFGTHHSKIMILFRHDDLAQIVIHTANMIPQDWTNMCQAVWRSPLLPRTPPGTWQEQESGVSIVGKGACFKRDLLAYLNAYGQSKTGALVKQLREYDFSAIKAALIASIPTKQNLRSTSEDETMWGWAGLRRTLRQLPVRKMNGIPPKPRVVIQVSSIASLGQKDKWLTGTMFDALSGLAPLGSMPRFSVIFPTADEIRRSLDGYDSGGSIHMKIQNPAQVRQVEYMRPMFCYWAGDAEDRATNQEVRQALRRRAAPHIKTYIRFSDQDMRYIDWAMVTSANLSTQAWGAATNANGDVRISSWEIGVLMWPDLLKEAGDERAAKMVPVFRKDVPDGLQDDGVADGSEGISVSLRMPYDLPLVPYSKEDLPWCATAEHRELDWMGRAWPGYEGR